MEFSQIVGGFELKFNPNNKGVLELILEIYPENLSIKLNKGVKKIRLIEQLDLMDKLK